MIKVVIVGAGSRGDAYARLALSKPEKMQVVGVVEPDLVRNEIIKERYSIPEENCFTNLEDFLARDKFADAPNISIDYALMEKVDYMVVAECDFDWADIGSWTALRSQIRADKNNNVVRGLYAGMDTENCIVVGDNQHLIATIDVKDLIIVNQGDVTLVCSEKSAQRVKDLVAELDEDPTMRKFL